MPNETVYNAYPSNELCNGRRKLVQAVMACSGESPPRVGHLSGQPLVFEVGLQADELGSQTAGFNAGNPPSESDHNPRLERLASQNGGGSGPDTVHPPAAVVSEHQGPGGLKELLRRQRRAHGCLSSCRASFPVSSTMFFRRATVTAWSAPLFTI